MVEHLNGFLARVRYNLKTHFSKIEMPGGFPGGMLKLQFDWYIIGSIVQNRQRAVSLLLLNPPGTRVKKRE